MLVVFPAVNITAQYFSDDNFIYTARPKKAVSVEYFKTLKKEEMNQSITYFDGLGRPVQNIAIGQGADGSDLITPIEYDGFGRQEKEYLPFSLPNPGNQYPRIDTQTAIHNAISFYNTNEYWNTTNPYSQKKFENSPLNRVLKQAAPGKEWAMGEGHEIKIDYQTNKNDEVRLFEVITTWDASSGLYDISFWDNGYYEKNELYKTITYDENSAANPVEEDGSTVEFTNKEGKVVLKRTYNANKPHDTYYVYDEYGNLTYVIPPKADAIITNEILDNLCYQYKHDNRNRRVEKKVPGKQWEFIVYDRLNRIVASGPANSPFQDDNTVGWLITKYDALGRQIYTGWDNKDSTTAGRSVLQQEYNAETPVLEPSQKAGTIEGILVNDSKVPSSSFKILTAAYYENFSFPNAATKPSTLFTQQVLFTNTRLVTGGWTRVPTTSSAVLGETRTIFYDVMRRPIENYIVNHLGGYTHVDDELDFTGRKLFSATIHKYSSATYFMSIYDKFTYSPQDRLLTHIHQIAGGAEQLMADNTYNSIGRLMKKSVGNTKAVPLEETLYAYNIRGWVTSINDIRGKANNTGIYLNLFAMRIMYNNSDVMGTGKAKPFYNGNITETMSRTLTDGGIIRDYIYEYDDLNRLTNAVYHTPNIIDKKNYFGESLEYDKNGNIQKLQRKFMAGVLGNPYADNMDDLNYFYKDNSNQLMKVTDLTNNPQGFKDDSDGFNDTEDDYDYDGNGNLTKDQNKNITEITYNHLNLPKKITFATGNTIDYIYNATGEKLEKNITENGVVTNTKYLNGGFQYKNNILQFFPTAEGYVRNTNETDGAYKFQYVFNYLDHLGNVRVSYAQNPTTKKIEILEENNYYPFGLKHQGYNTDNLQPNYKYKFNGKELQDELGLNMYDYGARLYDPARAGWSNIDPKAEKMRRFSPYNYCFDNPMRFTDPDGMEPTDWIKNNATGKYVWSNSVNKASQTPQGYSYVGKTDNSIIKDMGWNFKGNAITTTKMGHIASDSETGGAVSYGVSHLTTVSATTRFTVSADVSSNMNLSTGEFTKQFNGVSINVSVVGTATGTDNVAVTGMASTNFGGENYSAGLQAPDGSKPLVQEAGTTSVSGSILIPAEKIAAEPGVKIFPSVNVNGNWQNVKDDGSGATPVSAFGITPRTYNHTYPASSPTVH